MSDANKLSRQGNAWRLALAAAGLSMLGLGLATGLRAGPTPTGMGDAVVMRGDIEDVVLATGTLNATDMVAVGAQVNGQIQALHVKVGDRVRRGQRLAEIDPALPLSALDKARAQRDAAQAQLESRELALARLRKVLDRQRVLRDRQANAETDLDSAAGDVDTARSELNIARAQLRQAQLDVDAAQAELGFTRILAPADGEVLQVAAQAGQTLVSTQASPTLLVIGSLDQMTLKARISESDIARVRPGQRATFTIPGAPGRRWTAAIRSIESLPAQATTDARAGATPGPVYYDALLEVPNPDRLLRPAMSAQVRIALASASQVLTVPRAALTGRSEQSDSAIVLLLRAGKPAEARRVRLGLDNGIQVEVREGLREFDRLQFPRPPVAPDASEGHPS